MPDVGARSLLRVLERASLCSTTHCVSLVSIARAGNSPSPGRRCYSRLQMLDSVRATRCKLRLMSPGPRLREPPSLARQRVRRACVCACAFDGVRTWQDVLADGLKPAVRALLCHIRVAGAMCADTSSRRAVHCIARLTCANLFCRSTRPQFRAPWRSKVPLRHRPDGWPRFARGGAQAATIDTAAAERATASPSHGCLPGVLSLRLCDR